MKRITALLIVLFWYANAQAQEHCMSNAFHRSTELFPGSIGALNSQDYLVIYTDSIEFDGAKYKIKEAEISPFDNKDDLLRYFACYHDFFNESENISGELIKLQFDFEIPRIGDELQYIHYIDCGRFKQYIYVDDGLYYFSNSPFYEEAGVKKIERSEIEETIFKYTYNVDSNAQVYYVVEPDFELITEQFLAKDAYTLIEEVPGEFTEKFVMIRNEFSNCENVVYDTVYEQILVKEGGLRYDIIPAKFETRTELRVIQNEYEGHTFYERERTDSLQVLLRSPYNEIASIEVANGCDKFNFYDCVNISMEVVQGRDTLLFNVYEECQEGYQSAGNYCYNNSGIVPWVLDPRTYEVLDIPSMATEYIVPNEYMTIALIRIANKDELDEGCIEVEYDSVGYQSVLTPFTIKETIVPAEYETLVSKKYEDGAVIEVISGEGDTNYEIPTINGGSMEFVDGTSNVIVDEKPCYFEAIKLSLIEEGYLDENFNDDIHTFHLSVLKYQLDNQLPIGVIDWQFIRSLDIKFGY